MMRRFVLPLAAAAFVAASCGGPEAPTEDLAGSDGTAAPLPPETLRATIGPEGGTITGPADGPFAGFRLAVPPGAVARPTELVIEGVIDPTPLGPNAERVGPQFSISPPGVRFAKPASLTVPYDMTLRGAWEVPDGQCRVWFRDGAGWSSAEQTASDEATVTVPLAASTTVAAGVVRVAVPPKCLLGCTTAVGNCRAGDKFCIARIGVQHEQAASAFYSYTKGKLFWTTSPSANALALASFDVLERRALPTSGTVAGGLGYPGGDVVIDSAGARWLTIRFVGTARFDGTGPATLFDGNSSADRAVGVALEKSSGQAIRFRQRQVPSGANGLTHLSAVVGTQARYLGTLAADTVSPPHVDEVVARGRAVSNDLGYVARSASWGLYATNGQALPAALTLRPAALSCGDPSRPRVSTSDLYSSPRGQDAVLCTTASPSEQWWMTGRVETNERAPERGVREIDRDGNGWFASLTRASVVRRGIDGGVTEIPLTDAAPDTAAYAAMIPRSLHYDVGLHQLYVVTRGVDNVPELYEVTNLP